MKFPINDVIESFLDSLGISFDDIKFEGDLSSMSNSNYLFGTDVSYKKLVVRVDNSSNSRIIDRQIEKLNSKVLESLGIGPRTCFVDGYKISEYITSPNSYDKTNKSHLAALCKSLSTMHHSTAPFANRFDPIKMGCDYLNGLQKPDRVSSAVYEDIRQLMIAFDRIAPPSSLMVPCQIDLVPENLIYSDYDGKLYIIDQEYSGMFYLEWDLACLASETAMTDEEEQELIKLYEQESGYSVDMRLYYLCKAACNLLWSAWALYYDENEGNMNSYFNLRYGNYIVARDQYKEMNKSNE